MVQSQATNIAKGAIVKIPPTGAPGAGVAQYILFQYNPSTLQRTLQPRVSGGELGGHAGAITFTGAPVETFSMTIEIDARDQLSPKPAQNAVGQSGIYPLLYALETALYPDMAAVAANQQQLAQGAMGVSPYPTPQIRLVLGPNRVVPVALSSVRVMEQAFDAKLNPLRASIAIEARALSYSDVTKETPGYQTFVSYQKLKESLAKSGTTTDGSATGVQI